ncbi:MAG: pilus assembly protein PilM [Candidatus Portnoybacteria bacterium]|nr:pilus assembly protein PilM [Candidatus Portnoybacteria bacterium]
MKLGSLFSGLFGKKPKSCLGIDLGASSIKIAEISRNKEGLFLENYAIARLKENSRTNLTELGAGEIATILRHMIERAGIKTRRAVISLPVEETFSTVIDLPVMSEKELSQTIPFEARKYVPIPIEEVVLDWSVTAETVHSSVAIDSSAQKSSDPNLKESPAAREKKTLHILIVAVPREMIKKIAQIAGAAGLQVSALEQEAFGMTRSLIQKADDICMLVDLGTESVDAIVIEKGAIRLTHTFRESNPENMAFDIPKVLGIFEAKYSKKIKKIIFTGGRTIGAEWMSNLSAKLDKEIIQGNSFVNLKFDAKLVNAVKELSPYMAVAIGGAMRDI